MTPIGWEITLLGDQGIWRIRTEEYPGTFLLDEEDHLWKLQSYNANTHTARYVPSQEAMLRVDRSKVEG